MGAATILLYESKFGSTVSGICIDSCFSELNLLLYDFSYKYLTRVKNLNFYSFFKKYDFEALRGSSRENSPKTPPR